MTTNRKDTMKKDSGREARLVTAAERAYTILTSKAEMPEFYRSGALRDLRDALNAYKEDA